MFSVSLPINMLNATAIAMANEQSRPYLCGLFFDRRGYLVATNGHILAAARIEWPIETERDFGEIVGDRSGIIIPRETIIAFQKAIKSEKPDMVELRHDERGWSLSSLSVSMGFVPYDFDYAVWERVIPESAPDELIAAHYDPKYIKALADMAKALGGSKNGNAYFINQAGSSAAIVQFHESEDFIGVLMPMRNDAPYKFERDKFVQPLIDDND